LDGLAAAAGSLPPEAGAAAAAAVDIVVVVLCVLVRSLSRARGRREERRGSLSLDLNSDRRGFVAVAPGDALMCDVVLAMVLLLCLCV
jgi:hypothetical protein